MMEASVAKLLNTASLLVQKLNNMSNTIFEVEDAFRKEHVGFQYSLSVDKNDERELILSWEKDETSSKGKCRFFLTKIKDGKILLKKSLMQTTVQEKLEFYPFWNTFLDAIHSHLQQMIDVSNHK